MITAKRYRFSYVRKFVFDTRNMNLTTTFAVLAAVWTVIGTPCAFAENKVFEGNLTSMAEGAYIGVELQLTLSEDSSVDFSSLTTQCERQGYEQIKLETSYDYILFQESEFTRGEQLPWGPYPLEAGSYKIRVACNEEYTLPVPYNLTLSIYSGQFAVDQEPDPGIDSAVDLDDFKPVTGHIGYFQDGAINYPSNPYGEYDCGVDGHDSYYFYMYDAERTFNIKMEYDGGMAEGSTERDITVSVSYEKNGGSFEKIQTESWTSSGAVSNLITVKGTNFLQSDNHLYRLWVDDNRASLKCTTPSSAYGSYKMTLIVGENEGPNAELGSIQKILSKYWDEKSQKWVPIEALVVGRKSSIDIDIANRGSSSITVKLVHGLSVKGGPIKAVGTTQLTLPADDSFHSYYTTLVTPADTPVSLKGDLVTVLYDKDNHVLDTSKARVDMWGANNAVSVMTAIHILLFGEIFN